MNERIRQLIIETDEWLENNAQSDRWEREVKFADLIVRECLTVISKASKEATEQNTYMGDDVPSIVHQMHIAKHFGIK